MSRRAILGRSAPGLEEEAQFTSVGSRGFTLVLIGAVLWGSNGITGVLVESNSDMSWAAIVALRLMLGGLAMLVVTAATGELGRVSHNYRTWRTILVTAVCAIGFAGGFFQSLEYVGVAVATVISIGVSSVFLTLVSIVRDRRRPSIAVTGALVISFIGTVMVCGPGVGGWRTQGGDFGIGVGLSAMSGLAFGAQTLVNSRPVPGLRPRTLVALSFTLAGAFSMPWATARGFAFTSMTPITWISLGLLTFVSTLLGFLAYYAGLHRGIPPTTAAVPVAVETVVAGVLAVVVLGEQLSRPAIAGMVLILAGILLARPRLIRNAAPSTSGPFMPPAENSRPKSLEQESHATTEGPSGA